MTGLEIVLEYLPIGIRKEIARLRTGPNGAKNARQRTGPNGAKNARQRTGPNGANWRNKIEK